MAKVLEGIRVLDFGRYIAGPFCGTLLGDMGAEVIRIEKLMEAKTVFFPRLQKPAMARCSCNLLAINEE